jgi:hypothetical protein
MAEIRRCTDEDLGAILAIVNAAAEAYRGVIPPDRWREPYMEHEELAAEIADGVAFWGWEEDGELVGVMGIRRSTTWTSSATPTSDRGARAAGSEATSSPTWRA